MRLSSRLAATSNCSHQRPRLGSSELSQACFHLSQATSPVCPSDTPKNILSSPKSPWRRQTRDIAQNPFLLLSITVPAPTLGELSLSPPPPQQPLVLSFWCGSHLATPPIQPQGWAIGIGVTQAGPIRASLWNFLYTSWQRYCSLPFGTLAIGMWPQLPVLTFSNMWRSWQTWGQAWDRS